MGFIFYVLPLHKATFPFSIVCTLHLVWEENGQKQGIAFAATNALVATSRSRRQNSKHHSICSWCQPHWGCCCANVYGRWHSDEWTRLVLPPHWNSHDTVVRKQQVRGYHTQKSELPGSLKARVRLKREMFESHFSVNEFPIGTTCNILVPPPVFAALSVCAEFTFCKAEWSSYS